MVEAALFILGLLSGALLVLGIAIIRGGKK